MASRQGADKNSIRNACRPNGLVDFFVEIRGEMTHGSCKDILPREHIFALVDGEYRVVHREDVFGAYMSQETNTIMNTLSLLGYEIVYETVLPQRHDDFYERQYVRMKLRVPREIAFANISVFGLHDIPRPAKDRTKTPHGSIERWSE
eukprot:TRINITY_DN50016_c0_g1_i1.p1 TRINITY_DN50016_c0_g1~~TRINITY_DN50016_c0_g1_i1.p1  ORF type:complete len:148 (+),score=17.48 TRINITY_DN50016_c0_g1_i1:105-548(+)